jgi:hypothetical protein
MPTKIADTITALKGGLASLPIKAAVANIEYWETALAKVDGSSAILKDLGALRTGLQATKPDSAVLTPLLGKLGKETTMLAAKATGDTATHLKDLGKMLTGLGEKTAAH